MKKPTDLESRILEVLDNNIRVIQYSVYAVGFIGLAVIARSTYAFKKFTSSKDVPKEFISKAVKLQGKINGIECHQLLAPESEHFSVRLTVEHIPVASLNLCKKQSKEPDSSGLKIELIGVRPTFEGVNKWIKPALESNSVIWFRLYGVDYEKNMLYASVIVKRSWWKLWKPKDLSMIVLKENAGKVSPYLPSRQIYFNNIYPAYYRKLLHFEIKYMNKRK